MKWLALILIIMFLTIAPARTAVADDPGPGTGSGGGGGYPWPRGELLPDDPCVEDDGSMSRSANERSRSCQSQAPTQRDNGESTITIHAPFVTGLAFDVTGLRWFIGISTHP